MKNMKSMIWFASGLLVGLTILSISKASVPLKGRVTDDTAIYQNLSELHVKRQAKIDFDSDITNLAHLEKNYQEKLPSLADHPRLKGAIQRVSKQPYQYKNSKNEKPKKDKNL